MIQVVCHDQSNVYVQAFPHYGYSMMYERLPNSSAVQISYKHVLPLICSGPFDVTYMRCGILLASFLSVLVRLVNLLTSEWPSCLTA